MSIKSRPPCLARTCAAPAALRASIPPGRTVEHGSEDAAARNAQSRTDSLLNTWSQSAFFRWIIRLGALRGTVVAALAIDLVSLAFAIVVMLAFHRLSWMGILISGSIPLFLVPLHWYPFARISEQLYATESLLRKSEGKYRSILEKMNEAYVEIDRVRQADLLQRLAVPDHRLQPRGAGAAADRGFHPEPRLPEAGLAAPGGSRRTRRSAASTISRSPPSGGATRYLDVSFSRLRDEENRWCGYHAVLLRRHGENRRRARETGDREPAGAGEADGVARHPGRRRRARLEQHPVRHRGVPGHAAARLRRGGFPQDLAARDQEIRREGGDRRPGPADPLPSGRAGDRRGESQRHRRRLPAEPRARPAPAELSRPSR